MMQVYDRDGAIKCVVLDQRCYYTAEEIKIMREAGYRVKVDGKVWRQNERSIQH